jgi:squalene-hopene/tetraprenyl-beta-curcumene cyclase
VDDTAMVLLALSRVRAHDASRQKLAMRRGLEWVLSMQNSDGGWASFDKDNNKTLLCEVPYADHNAMLDPSAADITGRVLETLGALGYDAQYLPALRAIQFLRQQQESDGCWYGRWGVNFIYGTCFALRGLAAIGVDMREGFCLRAAEWLRSCQNPDGGWGESCDSYDNADLRGIGPSTAARRPGRCSDCLPPTTLTQSPCGGASGTCWKPSETGPGKTNILPAPVFPVSSI